ncbi:MarR family winged helix-turn-helix transcriptional regulator [Bradyrhizobium diversitatis]|uniref:MarR family transcriptional regulator n=1 Tax=Bradyrhizobium diversitatis TaxID=2755406 RepID=A0ABS0NVI7_9BRAD|nr:MarR family transcriptional regulator [Bradyrhizobium diversitatis]MBH5385026.1 MarR family transcriptional regulator [Bradyrhizobium diversitatis]
MKRDAIDKFAGEWAKEWPELDVSHLQTVGRIWRISEHLRRRFEVWLQPLGLNWETFDVIVSLRRSGAPYRMRPTELSEACLLTSGAMTNRLDRVERAGLIVRRPAPDDRRSVQVELTSNGITLADQVIQPHFAAARQLLECLDGKQQQTLAHLLRDVLTTLEPADGEAAGSDRMAKVSTSVPAKSGKGQAASKRTTAGKRARRPT